MEPQYIEEIIVILGGIRASLAVISMLFVVYVVMDLLSGILRIFVNK